MEDDLASKRARAESFLTNAPSLRRHAGEAASLDEKRLQVLKQALMVSGWICRDDEARPALMKFDGGRPAAGSRLYTIAERKWIDLGAVSADGKEIQLNEAAEQYIGWPVFALLEQR